MSSDWLNDLVRRAREQSGLTHAEPPHRDCPPASRWLEVYSLGESWEPAETEHLQDCARCRARQAQWENARRARPVLHMLERKDGELIPAAEQAGAPAWDLNLRPAWVPAGMPIPATRSRLDPAPSSSVYESSGAELHATVSWEEGHLLRLCRVDGVIRLDLYPDCAPGQLLELVLADPQVVHWRRFLMVSQGCSAPTARACLGTVSPTGAEALLRLREAADLLEAEASALETAFEAAICEDPAAAPDWLRWIVRAQRATPLPQGIAAVLERLRRQIEAGSGIGSSFTA